MEIQILTSEKIASRIQELRHKNQSKYHAMYSSWIGGIIKDPQWMLLPIDDHMVHRGDGVFEALKFINHKPYLLSEHLDRMSRSAEKISLSCSFTKKEIMDIVLATIKASGQDKGLVRIFLSRGPGGFSTNPYESVGSQLHVVITDLMPPSEEKYSRGASIGRSQIKPKDSWFAQIKSCNYLPNVLMKKESVDRDLDFTISFTEEGFVTEGSTENIIILDHNNQLLHPDLSLILKGTMMSRLFELAVQYPIAEIKKVSIRNFTENDIKTAREVMMVGTTLDVLPVTSYEGQRIADGRVGPAAKYFLKLLREDMK